MSRFTTTAIERRDGRVKATIEISENALRELYKGGHLRSGETIERALGRLAETKLIEDVLRKGECESV